MDKKNPAVYECKGRDARAKVHRWVRTDTGTAYCTNKGCGVELTLEQAADCFHDNSK